MPDAQSSLGDAMLDEEKSIGRPLMPGLERRLKAELPARCMFDRFTRGRYATDASHYQIMPLGVVVPRTMAEAERAIAIARSEGVSVLPRGGGTSQCGQTVNQSLVIDCSKHLNRIRRARCRGPPLRGRARHRARRSQPRAQAARAVVSGRYLDRLARHHRRHGRQQFLRRALAALRQHARQRALDRRDAGRRHARAFRPGRARPVRPAANSPLRPLARDLLGIGRAKPTRSRRAFRKCSAGSAATISMRSCRAATTSTSRISWSARKARSPSRRRSN